MLYLKYSQSSSGAINFPIFNFYPNLISIFKGQCFCILCNTQLYQHYTYISIYIVHHLLQILNCMTKNRSLNLFNFFYQHFYMAEIFCVALLATSHIRYHNLYLYSLLFIAAQTAITQLNSHINSPTLSPKSSNDT